MQGSAQDAPLLHLRKKIADGAINPTRWAQGRAKFSNQKTSKSDFRDVVLVF